jgi:AP-4 complex subunit mu-1
MFLSQIFILSPRGDKLVFKDYRQDVPRISDEIFFRKYKFWDGKDHQAPPSGDCPPFFHEKGIHFTYVKRSNLLFVATSMKNVSPSTTVEVLTRVVKIVKDFLGVLSEESIRKNFPLVYELLDEMIDVGVAQEMTTERLRPYIFNDVVPVANPEQQPQDSLLERIRKGEFMDRTRKAEQANLSVVQSSAERKNEIYIDIIERLNVVFNANGGVIASEVDGSIVMKSFLAGSPDLFLGLNEDLVVGRGDSARTRYATVVLDSVNFHAVTDFSKFESDRVLMMRPPDGEFTVMNYRVTGDITQPFRITPSIEVQSSFKAELTLRIRADVPTHTYGLNVAVKVPVPKTTTSLGVEFGVGASGQTYEYKSAEKYVVWNISRFGGGTEQVCKIRFSTSSPITAATRKEVGPISMSFEVPQHNVSGLAIKSLRLEERSQTYNPSRWIRNITQANSYVCRMSQ